jgi:hypothetical protein
VAHWRAGEPARECRKQRSRDAGVFLVNLFNRAEARMRSAPRAIRESIERSLTESKTRAAGAGGGAGMSEGLECGTSDKTGLEWWLKCKEGGSELLV